MKPVLDRALPEERPFDVVCLGYNSVDLICRIDKFLQHGHKAPMRSFERQGGGQAATAAVAVSRLGFRARYLGKFGCDDLGAFSRKSLEDEGIETRGSVVADGAPNQLAIVLVDSESGERTITYYRDPKLDLCLGELDMADVTSGRVLLCDAHQVSAVTQAAAWARASGMQVVLDAERVLPGIDALLSESDFIVSDSSFARDLTGRDDPESALAELAHVHGKGSPVVMTLGRDGALAYDRGNYLHSPAFEVDVEDTTGAGDVFHAAFACGLMMGYDLPALLTFCNAAAALKSTALGGRAGVPDLKRLLEFIRERGRG